MAENFSNGAQTTLNGAMDNVQTTATLTSASGWPTAPFRALISTEGGNVDEIILVGARSGTSLTSITRAAEAIADGSQVAVAHSSGATITQVLTASGVTNRRQFPLDRYNIDATYGDDFTASSLSGIWTRRTYTSGDETYQQGIDATFMRVALTTHAAAGTGYLQSSSSDGTYAMKFIIRNFAISNWGVALVDSNGTGVVATYFNSPAAFLLLQLTTYSTYGGNYVEAGYSGASPNVSLFLTDVPIGQRPIWLYVRKSGTSCFVAVSLDGEIWGPESSAFTWAGTMNRVGMLNGPLGTSVASQGVVDIDWFNKIA